MHGLVQPLPALLLLLHAPSTLPACCCCCLLLLRRLAGTASSDPDGNDDIATYSFAIVPPGTTGPAVATKTSTNGKATLSQAADGLATNTAYDILLTVTDKSGLPSNTARQALTVGNCAPTAALTVSPAAPQTVPCNGGATLDGSKSSDTDGSVVSYAWKLVYGNQTITKSGSSASVSQTTDTLVPGATYSVSLIVKDDKGASSTAATSVLTVASGCVAVNNPPVCANAVPSMPRMSTLVSEGVGSSE